jgi:GntR family transcriptional repressor for pyruvate dehydrogenase complex
LAQSAEADAQRPNDWVFRSVRAGNTFEEAVESLLLPIKLGVIHHGDRLPSERELALILGVSRVTLREAVRALNQAGYVESRRGRYGGTFVTYRPRQAAPRRARRIAKTMGDSLSDALVLRQALEVGAATAAAQADISDDERSYLKQRLADVTGADARNYRQADSRLHLAIAELTGSPSLSAAVADVRLRLNDLLDAIPLLAPNIEHSDRQHAAVVKAIVAGKPERAALAMADHVEGTAALLRAFLG